MRRIVVLIAAFLTILAIQAPAFAGNGNGNDTEVCHSHGGKHEKARTIRVNGNALPAFLAGGGTEGPCEEPPAEEPPTDDPPGDDPPGDDPVNTPPVANATYSRFFSNVTLDGSGSFDPDGDALTFTWTVVDGTGIVSTLSGATASFVYTAGVGYEVTLTVSDGAASDSTTLTIQ